MNLKLKNRINSTRNRHNKLLNKIIKTKGLKNKMRMLFLLGVWKNKIKIKTQKAAGERRKTLKIQSWLMM